MKTGSTILADFQNFGALKLVFFQGSEVLAFKVDPFSLGDWIRRLAKRKSQKLSPLSKIAGILPSVSVPLNVTYTLRPLNYYLSRNVRKRTLVQVRSAKIKTSLRFRAV